MWVEDIGKLKMTNRLFDSVNFFVSFFRTKVGWAKVVFNFAKILHDPTLLPGYLPASPLLIKLKLLKIYCNIYIGVYHVDVTA